MSIFNIEEEQIVNIAAGLVADELGRRFGKYTETLTLSRWAADTKVGRGGIDTNVDQRAACAERVASFFGHGTEEIDDKSGDTLGDWASKISKAIRSELLYFRFHPASQIGNAETRHNADDIYQDAAAVASLFQGRRRVVSMVSPHNVLGMISSVLAPNLLRLEVIDARTKSPDELANLLAFGDLIIATPTLWRYLADTVPAMPSNVMGLSFGERLGVDLAGRIRQRGVGAMRELYGSTENGVMAWRDSPADPFVFFDHWSRDGEAVVRSRSNGQNHSQFPMDDFDWRSQNSFELGSRRDGAVQIGAVNVFPHTIAGVIEEHTAIEKCEVRVSRRTGALDRLIAEVRLKDGRTPDQAMAWSVDEWCRQRLRPTERPRIYTFLPPLDS